MHYGKSRLLHIAELTAVCLFRSWYPILLQGEPSSPSLVSDYEYARLFTAVMDRVCKQVAWNPRPTLGLNWQTPAMTRVDEDREWICTIIFTEYCRNSSFVSYHVEV